ncbi:adenylosuccinate synthetase, partial [Rickettsiales bacterium]|nr:adenylosuccinate synthetase [Rickettsiales bacterium]
TIKICTSYEIDGKILNYLPSSIDAQSKVKPIYEELPGWQEDIGKYSSFDQLPENAKKYINKIEDLLNIKVSILSLGPKRDQTIIIQDFLNK